MSNQLRIIDTLLTDAEFDVLQGTDPGSPDATQALEAIGAMGLPSEVALHVYDDNLGNRTARFVALALGSQGDVILQETAQAVGLPTARQARDDIARRQAAILEQHDPATALKILTSKPGQGGNR